LWTRKSKYRQAKEAVLHAWSFQFADRKKKKRTMRNLWTIKINAAARAHGRRPGILLRCHVDGTIAAP
jgi:large subunit ribosomal protein L20